MRYLAASVMAVLVFSSGAAQETDGTFVVHEWGTFTSFAGSDGVHLEFRPLVDNDLPKFVFDRPKQAGFLDRRSAIESKRRIESRQRMETPVIYFYSDRERVVDVKVDFPEGLLTEFYPPVRDMGPKYRPGRKEVVRDSFLKWGKIRILPAASVERIDRKKYRDARIAAGDGKDHYEYARETDANIVRVCFGDSNYYEKFLFYRGVGNFTLPVTLKALGRDRFVLNNSYREAICPAFLVEVRCGKVRFTSADHVMREREMTLPKETSTINELSEAIVGALVKEGLYEKEARAMVKTWRTSWFGEEGTRLFYFLPQSLTDRILPLRVSPRPQKTVRVMVGRLEILTPERERRIEGLIAKLGDDSFQAREEATRGLERLGRFAEPALKRVRKTTDDLEVRARAQRLLDRLRK